MEKRWEYSSMYDVETRHNGHFFDADAKRFFRSRIGTTVWNVKGNPGYGLFTTSEQGPSGERLFTVRMIGPEGSIDTVGEFNVHSGSVARRMASTLSDDPAKLKALLLASGHSASHAAEGLVA